MKNVKNRTLLAALGLLLLAPPGRSQSLSYSLLPVDGAQPSARFDGTIAFDSAERRIYLFGGQDTAARNDLWAYSLAQRRWEEVPAAGTKPPARSGHTLIFDSARRRLVVFGGQASGFFSDVWAYDIAQGSWRQLAPEGAGPSRRYGHSAIYDAARDRMIVSHGFTNSGRFDDTWAFHFAANSWQDLNPPSVRPLRRCLHHAVYDPAADQMYLYGGCASGFGPCPLGDLWAFDLATHRWTERAAAVRPPAREHYGIAFDTARGRLVLFGGTGGGLLNDTWEFEPLSGSWREPVISGPVPSPRSRHQSAYDSGRGTAFFFGGLTASSATNELWMLGPGFASVRPEIAPNGVANAFSGEGGAVAPGEIAAITGSGLGPITGVSFAFDEQTGRLPASGPGVAVTWNGIPAPLHFARADQLNVQAPYELEGAAEARLVVTVNGQASGAVAIPVVPAHPGLYPRVWNEDGSLNSPASPAAPGSIVVLYATGLGVTNPRIASGASPSGVYPEPAAPTSLLIGGVEAELLFRGLAPGASGVIQLNARVPEGVGPSAAAPVTLIVGAARAQAGVGVAIR